MIKQRGGKRENSGRKKKYDDPVSVSFIVERELKEEVLIKHTPAELRKLFLNWFKGLVK